MSVQGIIIYRAAYFGFFDTSKVLLTPKGKELNFFYNWGIAQAISLIFRFSFIFSFRLSLQSPAFSHTRGIRYGVE